MNDFERGQEPLEAMHIGIKSLVEDWLDKNNTAKASHKAKIEGNVVIVDVKGDVVLVDFEIVNADGIRVLFGVKFGNVTGSITILNELTPKEIYSRIKNYYKKVLDKCVGKTPEEQEDFLFGEEGIKRYPPNFKFKQGIIENSEQYVRNLPDNPTQEQIKDLVKQVLSGSLEYGFHAIDKYSVEMHQYAKVLEKIASKN